MRALGREEDNNIKHTFIPFLDLAHFAKRRNSAKWGKYSSGFGDFFPASPPKVEESWAMLLPFPSSFGVLTLSRPGTKGMSGREEISPKSGAIRAKRHPFKKESHSPRVANIALTYLSGEKRK